MIRIVFQKKGFLRYISHLDLQRTMQRALSRAEIPLWYTEGFNPHPYLSFVSPLPVGVNSVTEIFDIKPDENKKMEVSEIKERLNASLDKDLSIVDVYETDTSLNDIVYAEYSFTVEEELTKDFKDFLLQDEIFVIRKTKRKEEEINLKDEISNLHFENEKVILTLPAGNVKAIKPLLVIKAFNEKINRETKYYITREKFLTADFKIFR